MNWKKRGAKILGSYVTGYTGGLALIFPLTAINEWHLELLSFLAYPAIAGLLVAGPQLGKTLIEYGAMEP
jgi:peptidoglycan biosynthesis protein MviN/MurJ (putative lipid II flippase)